MCLGRREASPSYHIWIAGSGGSGNTHTYCFRVPCQALHVRVQYGSRGMNTKIQVWKPRSNALVRLHEKGIQGNMRSAAYLARKSDTPWPGQCQSIHPSAYSEHVTQPQGRPLPSLVQGGDYTIERPLQYIQRWPCHRHHIRCHCHLTPPLQHPTT